MGSEDFLGESSASSPSPSTADAEPDKTPRTYDVGAILAGKYRVERVLGEGGMGVVVGVRHEQLGTMAAIKYIRGFQEASSDEIARFAREAKIAAKLKSEHVVRVSDVGTLDSGEPYLLMEYLEGKDLAAILAAEGPLPIADAIDYALQACDALSEAHAAGIVHRDLKPSNLFRTKRRDGSALVKILDFGVSKLLPTSTGEVGEGTLTAPMQIIGSPLYMSPEQIDGSASTDARTDIWAMGVTLYRLMTGKSAFAAPTHGGIFAQILTAPTPRLRDIRPDAPPEVEAVLDRCMRKAAGERYQTIGELIAALIACRSTSSARDAFALETTPPEITPRHATPREMAVREVTQPISYRDVGNPAAKKKRWPVVAALVGAVLVVLTAAILIVRARAARAGDTPEGAPASPPEVAASAAATDAPDPAASLATPAPATPSAIPTSPAHVRGAHPPVGRPRTKPVAPAGSRYDDSQYGGRK